MKFRQDINGLRALAVIAVVLFHFKANLLTGGFSGVDVFFVISGFLMTSIIYRGLESEQFSIIAFYRARGRRIIPALAFLCLLVLIFAWSYLPPMDYQQLSKHVFSSLSFLSNMTYWQEAGYFDAASHEKWLLHTWSLSAEWQFYIFYPLVLLMISKVFPANWLRWLVLLGTILALILSVYASYTWPSLAFYSLPTRAWEMMLGGLAFLFPVYLSSRNKTVLEWCGLIMILYGYFTLTGNDVWPGYLALIPALGTYFVLVSAKERSFITGNVITQWFGKISYSLYLWHWPVVVALGYFSYTSSVSIVLGILFSVIAASFSYYLIEQKVYKNSTLWVTKLYDFVLYLAVFVVAMVFAVTVFLNKGFVSRSTEPEIDIMAKQAESDWHYPPANIVREKNKIRQLKTASQAKTLFLGDSLIEQYYPRMEYLTSNDASLNETWFLTHGGCFPTAEIISYKRDCKNLNDVKNVLSQYQFEKIVISGDWFPRFNINEWQVNIQNKLTPINTPEGRKKALSIIEQVLIKLKNSSQQVVLVLTLPTGKRYDFKEVARQSFRHELIEFAYPKSHFEEKYQAFNKELIRIAQKHNITLVNPLDYLCGPSECSVVDKNDEPIYKDIKHIRASYMREHVSFLDFAVKQ
jgi:peptidoglycan/LPS O-acetylase OafA/YrhL